MFFNKGFNPEKFRQNFKCLREDKRPPIYLDNACMTLKPDSVIKAITEYYFEHPSCHNRAVHEFGEQTTKKVDKARELINKYINCRSGESIVFAKNTTESINMVASFIEFKAGDIIVTTDMEHNSNMLPWQFLNVKKNVIFKQVSIDNNSYKFNFEEFENLLKTEKVKLVSVFHMSNITGIKLPIKRITELAHKYGALVLLDAAQSVPHSEIDVQDLDIDFMAFSIHKAFGPTGVGVLYGKEELLRKAIPPYIGGEGIEDTTYETCTLSESPKKFEVGLQNYAGIIGAGEAIRFLSSINFEKASEHLNKLNQFVWEGLASNGNVGLIGPSAAQLRHGIINLNLKNKNPAEIGLLLSKMSRIMVRSGVHCGHSWYHKRNLTPTLRISLAPYNTQSEMEILVKDLYALTK